MSKTNIRFSSDILRRLGEELNPKETKENGQNPMPVSGCVAEKQLNGKPSEGGSSSPTPGKRGVGKNTERSKEKQ